MKTLASCFAPTTFLLTLREASPRWLTWFDLIFLPITGSHAGLKTLVGWKRWQSWEQDRTLVCDARLSVCHHSRWAKKAKTVKNNLWIVFLFVFCLKERFLLAYDVNTGDLFNIIQTVIKKKAQNLSYVCGGWESMVQLNSLALSKPRQNRQDFKIYSTCWPPLTFQVTATENSLITIMGSNRGLP